MRIGLLGSLTAWLLCAGLAFAQAPIPAPVPNSASVTAPDLPGPASPYPPGTPAEASVAEECPNPGVPGFQPVPLWLLMAKPDCEEIKEPSYHEGHFWIKSEYLMWWIKDGREPAPLLSTGPPASLGILSNPGAFVTFGGRNFDFGQNSGIRVSAGFCEPCETCGIEGSGFLLFDRTIRFRQASDAGGSPVIARPFFNALLGRQDVQLIALPGAFSGDVAISTTSQLWGSEVNFVGLLFGGCQANIDMLLGFRYTDLKGDFNIVKNTTILSNGLSALNGVPVLAPNANTVEDHFQTRNQFFGGQIGAQMEFRRDRYFVDLVGKVALGDNHELVVINGSTTLRPPGGPNITVPGGLLAEPSNTGRRTHDEFAVIPEVQVALGYTICKNIRVSVAYNLLFWTDVVLPGDQIDGAVNESQTPTSLNFGRPGGTNNPLPLNRQTSFWAHGLSFGVALRY